jgi:S-formylglutathione hydrolase FrmB
MNCAVVLRSLWEGFFPPIKHSFFPAAAASFARHLHAAVRDSKYNLELMIDELIRDGKEFPALYLACGTEDGLLPLSEDMDSFLTQRGIKHTFETGSGNHEWDFWNRFIKRVVEWLPLEQ